MEVECKLGKKNDKYSTPFHDCVRVTKKHILSKDIENIGRIIFLSENKRINYHNAGGMYFLQRENNPAYIELYLQQIINVIPAWLPRQGIFLKYSIVRMILHEIGHHVNVRYAYERNRVAWERASEQYANRYLWKIYGLWMCLFLTIGSIEGLFSMGGQKIAPHGR